MNWAAPALAAIVSILAAVIASLSARRARLEARSITTLNHKVAALDRQAEQMRDDYRDLIKAIAGITESIGRKAEANVVRLGMVLAAGEVVRAHPQANEPLCAAIEQMTDAYADSVSGIGHPISIADHIESIRTGFRESLAEIERMRSELLR
jgi:nucleotidyltransferase/DNA polymerase involved in DNA repair